MSQPFTSPVRIIRKILPFTTAAACLALIYLAWVFYSRSSQNSELQKQADEKSAEQERKTYEMYGSGQLKILLFYAVPAIIERGASAQLCYSVANAVTVKIDQGVEEIRPSISRCVPVKPAHTTTYTISAADEKGHETTRSADVVVR